MLFNPLIQSFLTTILATYLYCIVCKVRSCAKKRKSKLINLVSLCQFIISGSSFHIKGLIAIASIIPSATDIFPLLGNRFIQDPQWCQQTPSFGLCRGHRQRTRVQPVHKCSSRFLPSAGAIGQDLYMFRVPHP